MGEEVPRLHVWEKQLNFCFIQSQVRKFPLKKTRPVESAVLKQATRSPLLLLLPLAIYFMKAGILSPLCSQEKGALAT